MILVGDLLAPRLHEHQCNNLTLHKCDFSGGASNCLFPVPFHANYITPPRMPVSSVELRALAGMPPAYKLSTICPLVTGEDARLCPG